MTDAPSTIWASRDREADTWDAGTFCSSNDGGMPYVRRDDLVEIATQNALNLIESNDDQKFRDAIQAVYSAGIQKGFKNGCVQGERIGRNHLSKASFFYFWFVTFVLSMIIGVTLGLSLAQLKP